MQEERIGAGLAAFCAGASPDHRELTLRVARELVRSGGEISALNEPGTPARAALRALPIGFATAPGDVVRRRHIAESLTPGDPDALAAACAVAAMASYAVAGAPMFSVFAAGLEEAGAVVAAAREPLTRAAVGRWRAPENGVPEEALPAVAAVVSVLCHGEPSPGAAMDAAAALGGATDAVAAIAGGIAAARSGGLDGIDGPEFTDGIGSLAAELSALRS